MFHSNIVALSISNHMNSSVVCKLECCHHLLSLGLCEVKAPHINCHSRMQLWYQWRCWQTATSNFPHLFFQTYRSICNWSSFELDQVWIIQVCKILDQLLLLVISGNDWIIVLNSTSRVCACTGSTAIVAVLDGDMLTVANVGDSRGVLCDGNNNAVTLSEDHKPNLVSVHLVMT